MRKQTVCICENKDADQLRGNREADQRLCFRYMDSTLPLLPKSEISSTDSVIVQPDLFQTRSETTLLVFPRGGSYIFYLKLKEKQCFLLPFRSSLIPGLILQAPPCHRTNSTEITH